MHMRSILIAPLGFKRVNDSILPTTFLPYRLGQDFLLHSSREVSNDGFCPLLHPSCPDRRPLETTITGVFLLGTEKVMCFIFGPLGYVRGGAQVPSDH